MSETAEKKKNAAFGIEGLLKEDARVLYENVFSTKHIGRVLDFILFESQEFFKRSIKIEDCEYRVRQSIELAFFNAWTNYREAERVKCVELEFGWDKERFVFSSVHYAPPGLKGFLPIRNEGETPNSEVAGRIAAMLTQIQHHSDGLMVRYDPKTGRLQTIAFILPDRKSSEDSRNLEYVDMNEIHMDQSPEGQAKSTEPEPFSSGRIDAFLDEEKEDSIKKENYRPEGVDPVAGDDASQSADWLQKASDKASVDIPKESNEESKKKSESSLTAESNELMKVKGLSAKDEAEPEFRIKSGETLKSDEVRKVKRLSAAGQQGTENIMVKGSAEESGADLLNAMSSIAESSGGESLTEEIAKADAAEVADQLSSGLDAQEAEESVQVLLQTMKAEVMPLCPDLKKEQFDEAFLGMSQKVRENYMQTMHHLLRLKNIQTISKVKHYKDQISVLTAKIDQLNSEKKELIDTVSQKDSVEGEILKLKNSDNPEEVSKATKIEEEKFNKVMEGYKKSLESGGVPQGAQDWAKGFMETMLKERAVLGQRAREIDAHLKKKEYDLKTKETTFKEQLRTKDELIRQKEFSLQKSKEALSNALATLEKKRAEVASSGAGKAEGQGKVITLERLLHVSKESNEKMQKRVDDLQAKWQSEFNSRAQVQQECSRLRKQLEDHKRKYSDAGMEKIQTNYVKVSQEKDRALKIIDELKRQTKELQGKLTVQTNNNKANTAAADAVKKTVSSGDTELKYKLEQSYKMNKVTKDELERLRRKFDEIKQEETKMRIEVARLQEELKKAGRAVPSVGSGTPNAPKTKGGFKR